MAKAKQLPSGSWRVQVFDGIDARGKRKYISFTADTAKEAELLALEYQLKKKRLDKPENITVGEAIDRYIESKDAVLSPTTIKNYISIRKNYLGNIINLKLNKITPELIQREINKESKIHSAKTVYNIHGLLSATLKLYYPDMVLRTTLPKKEKIIMQIPNDDDIRVLMTETYNTEMELPILLSVSLGLRRSEICGLLWEDVDLKKRTITIRQAKVTGIDTEYIIKTPKSYAGNRTLTISQVLYNALEKQVDKNGFVIKLTPQAITKRFLRLFSKLNIKNFRFHDLRHFNASVMLMLRIPDKYAMKRGGWATEYTMKNVYQHTFETETNEYENQVNNYMDNLLIEQKK